MNGSVCLSGLLWGVLMLLWLPNPARAQMFSYEPREQRAPLQALTVGVQWVQFGYTDGGNPLGADGIFYQAPAVGLHYARPGLTANVAYGISGANEASEEDLRFVDAALFLSGDFSLVTTRRMRLYLPILLHSGYRSTEERSRRTETDETFNVSTLGLGSGLGFFARMGKTILEARATPMIGLALRSVQGAAGNTRVMEADVQLHREKIAGRVGVSVGAGIRAQAWSVRAADFLPGTTGERFTYRSLQQVIRVGVNW